jgi:8-oxo-dGTP diphosphatase
MASERITTAAGGIVWRRRPVSRRDRGESARIPVELLLIHRPSYDDWTFPKGKTDPGECLQETAVREIWEETGITARLTHPLPQVRYRTSSGTKVVSYWVARQADRTESTFSPNKEVDEIRWVRPRDAAALLTYSHDRQLLADFKALRDDDRHRSRTLVVLRHAKAMARDEFDGDDLDRPLVASGESRARDLMPLLAAYGVRRAVSSPAVRCASTVEPFVERIGSFLQVDDRLSEDTSAAQVARSVHAVMDGKVPVVLCSHNPTLPWIFDAVGTDVADLQPGEGVVVHHRKGHVLATEAIRRPGSQHER